jgi:signal transduction histidine kinase/HPt (histidine-containing phosphotransfer) domain-containing protein
VRAKTVAEAVAALERVSPHVVVLDLSLPDAEGEECFRAVHEADPEVPIVVLTGNDDDELALGLLESGAQDYLLKSALSTADIQRCLRYAIKRGEAERVLERARRAAEEANRAKDSFVAAMSHEIRTPLNAILGMADLLLETPLRDDQRDYVQVFARAGHGLLDLLENALERSRISTGRFELRHEPCDIVALAEDTVEMFGFVAHEKGVGLVADVAPDVPRKLLGDPARLRQILVNLVSNAIKFTDTGCVEVEVRLVPGSQGKEFEIEVSDTGPGIPPDRIDSVFAGMVHADAADFARYGGTGLGLSICLELATRMDGSIEAENRPTGGARFTVQLPLLRDAEDSESPGSQQRLAGRRVLVAVSSRAEGRRYAAWLRNEGAVATLCTSRESVRVALTGDSRFDAVMVDSRLDGQRGLAIAEELAARPERPRHLLVLLSMDQGSDDYARCECIGARPLMKPLRRELLVEASRGRIPAACVTRDPDLARLGPLKILLAEDSVDNRNLVAAFLRGTGVSLTCVGNGAEAVRAYQESNFDLVLMDVNLPVLDGHEATRRIRAWEHARGIPPQPVVALTAHTSAEDVKASREAGCDAHVSKPFSRQALHDAVSRYAWASVLATTGVAADAIDSEIAELLPEYLERRYEDVATLNRALREHDFEVVQTLGHRMKGSGASYGLPRVSEIGAALEIAAKGADQDGAEGAVLELSKLIDSLADAV